MGAHSLTPSHTPGSMKCDSWLHSWPAPSQALALVTSLRLRLRQKTSSTNNSTNYLNPIGAPKVWKPKSKVKKLKISYIEWSTLYGDQITHFVGYIKSPNVKNSCCNHKKVRTTFSVGPTICVSSSNERRTQVGWVVAIGWKVQKWTKTNNVIPIRSPCHVLDFDEMTMKSPCWETWKKYSAMGMHRIFKHMGKIDPKNWAKIVILEKWLIMTPNWKHYQHPPIAPLNLDVNLTPFECHEPMFHICHESLHWTDEDLNVLQ